ncbi:redoxin domain-containing protein [Halopiger aswanensis]|uniref:Peroxiredoxin n=1 Tax=Halopiger aswanensis TaxID=148449 RepID=A0A419WEP1_9EURY|nr:redoxin domain-containing protein [Halopiger aswanensis]RKD93950.1 peroxiredoxin [Halopiger aswanensis]
MPDFEVVDLGPADNPEAGDEAPDFTRPLVTDEYWENRSLSELVAEHGRTIVVFTPMTGSFLAKYVWDELAERGWDEKAHVVGVTASTPYGVKRFLEDNEYPFTVFADPAADVARDYGIDHDLDGMAGITEPRPAVFAVGEDLTVEDAWVGTDWPDFPDYDDLEERFGLE